MTRLLPGQPADADRVHNLSAIGVYTPLLADVDIGDGGESEGAWHLTGGWVYGWARYHLLGPNIVDSTVGRYGIVLPYQYDTSLLTQVDTDSATQDAGLASVIGWGWLRDNDSSANQRLLSITVGEEINDQQVAWMMFMDDNTGVEAGSPFTLADNDRISVVFSYPARMHDLAGVR